MSSTVSTDPKFDVFLSFRGSDTRRNLIGFLYKELVLRNIRTFKDDKELESGQRISTELVRAIGESKLAIVVISANYPGSSFCLDELVKIMDFKNKGSLQVMPIFYGVDPCDLRRQTGVVAQQFEKHEARVEHEKVLSWRQALTSLADISGDCSGKWEDDSKLVDEITEKISNELASAKPSNGNNLDGIDQHMRELYPLLDLDSNEDVRIIGIWGMGSIGRSALATHVYQDISHNFVAHCFLQDVRNISQRCHKSHLQEEFLSKIQGEGLVPKSSYSMCFNAIKARLRNKKILLVINDVNNIQQIDALADDFSWFGPGSRIIITTPDRQLLNSSVVKSVYEVEHLKCSEVLPLDRSLAFKQRQDPVGFELSTYRATNLSVNAFWTLLF